MAQLRLGRLWCEKCGFEHGGHGGVKDGSCVANDEIIGRGRGNGRYVLDFLDLLL